MYAIISDLHSNLEATEAVFADLDDQGAEKIVCLGDVIGYGPNPREVLTQVADRCEFILLGNHEEGLLHFGDGFNPKARAALEWTSARLSDPDEDRDANYRFWNLIDEMPRMVETDDAVFVHGSLIDETKDYVMPSDIDDREKMTEIFRRMNRNRCFFGHTHVPGVWTEGGRYLSPDDVDGEYVVGEECVVINVGSVGQPRDGDNRASYVLVDGDRVTFRRVPYEFVTTMRKIASIDDLPDMLAARLKVGR